MPEHPDPKSRPHPWRRAEPAAPPPSLPAPERPGAPAETTAVPAASAPERRPRRRGADDVGPGYVELDVTTNFTFLTGASHPEEYVERAAALGQRAVAITDRHTLAGVVRAHVAAKEAGIGLVVGCRLGLAERLDPRFDEPDVDPWRTTIEVPVGPPIEVPPPSALDVLVYPTSRDGYANLCRMLTLGKRRAPKGHCLLSIHDLLEHHRDLIVVVCPPVTPEARFLEAVRGLQRTFTDDRLFLAATAAWTPDDVERSRRLAALAAHLGIPLVVTNDVHHHAPSRRPLQDVLTCVRHGCTVHEAGRRLRPHAEGHLQPTAAMRRRFPGHDAALARTEEIAARATAFSLDELRYEYPEEVCPPGVAPMAYLRALTFAGAAERYADGLTPGIRARLEHEFELIEELSYAAYFLTVHDLVRFARSRRILCQGRGAAANSAVCYCLGVTAVDPDRADLLFERFVSKERDEPPDIDIDFEHERREEVIQYIYGKYGRERAALTATVISYRGRSAVREVGKALGFSPDCVDRVAKNLDWWRSDLARRRAGEEGPSADEAAFLRDVGLDPNAPMVRRWSELSADILGFPRHLSQHVGGFVITQRPLCELVPIENASMIDRTVIEWDKDDIDAMGMLKVDCLGLGMLTCLRKAFDLINGEATDTAAEATASADFAGSATAAAVGGPAADPATDAGLRSSALARGGLSLNSIPAEDPAVYDMICDADTVGVFQIESRAQMSMLPRLRPRCFYDLVIEVAIVRPGPIQGDMVHPYLRRRNGEEPIEYPNDAVKRVLGRTLGVPLFQEQAMALSMVAAGFTPGEADQLRRAMAAWKRKGDLMEKFGARLIDGMLARGYTRDFAERCYAQLRGFSEYGFPESHAASFALIVYVSCWLKRHHPAAFAAALINSQPMGFYAPAQIVRDAQNHGVPVRTIDVNHSGWDCHLEPAGPFSPQPDAERRRGSAYDAGKGGPALRLGLRLVKGFKKDDADRIATAVAQHGPFDAPEALRRASGASLAGLHRLAAADAFVSMGLDRQRARWALTGLRDDPLPLFDAVAPPPAVETEIAAPLPDIPPARQVIADYAATRLSLKAHPMSFLREELERRGCTPAGALADETAWPHGRGVRVAGIVLVRQRPGTAKGVVFMTLEDETGIANLILWAKTYDRFRRVGRHGVAVLAHGRVERQGAVVHVHVKGLASLDHRLAALRTRSRDFH